MANYSSLKSTIDSNVRTNGTEAITGAVLNTVLNAMVNSLGAGYQYMGVAIPSTNPGTPDQNVFYIAGTEGTYTNFGGIVVANEVAALVWNGSWSKQNTGIKFVSVSQNNQTGHTDINIGSDSYPVASVEEVSQLGQELSELLPSEYRKILEWEDGFYYNGGNHSDNSSFRTSGSFILKKGEKVAFTGSKGSSGLSINAITKNNNGTYSALVVYSVTTGTENIEYTATEDVTILVTSLKADFGGEVKIITNYDIREDVEDIKEGAVFADNSLPMISRASNLQNIPPYGGGSPITPQMMANFLLDFKLIGTPDSGYTYALDVVNYNQGGDYSYYLAVYKKDSSNNRSLVSANNIGSTLSRTGIQVYSWDGSGSISKIYAKVNWSALGNLSGAFYYITNYGYIFDQDYIFDGNVGELALLAKFSKYGGYMDVATPETSPVSVSDKIFYIASVPGTYENFGSSFTLKEGDAVILSNSGSGWKKEWIAYSGRFFDPHLYGEQTHAEQYEPCISELYIAPEYCEKVDFMAMWAFGDSPDRKVAVYGGTGKPSSATLKFLCSISAEYSGIQDGDIVPIIVTSGTAIPIGTTIGYVIFKDISTFLTYTGGTPVSVLNLPFVKNVANSATILDTKIEDSYKKKQYKYLTIQIPNMVYAIPGTELNIWNDTIALSADKGLQSPINYKVNWVCSKGKITQRGFRFLPTDSDTGYHACTCQLFDLQENLVASKTFYIWVISRNALASSKNIVFFGDSTGEGTAQALYNDFQDTDKFTGTPPTMYGTKGSTFKYEATGGWRWPDYATKGRRAFRCQVSGVGTIPLNSEYTNNGFTWTVVEVNVSEGSGNILITKGDISGTDAPQTNGTLVPVSSGDSIPYTDATLAAANPLWNDNTESLDISLYRSRIGLSGNIDAVAFLLGLNGSDLPNATIKQYIKDLYDAFIADNPSCKFILGLVTSAGNTLDGFGANYGASFDAFGSLVNFYKERELYLSLQGDSHFSNLIIATPHLSLDRYYGYRFGVRNISQRFNGYPLPDDFSLPTKEVYHTNWVHPASSGYGQMGDSFFAAFIASLI